jgi:hypothetical protein
MSKLTRGQLKDLVKECLVEILSEGLATPTARMNAPSSTVKMNVQERQAVRPIPARAQSPALNAVSFSNTNLKTPQKNFESSVKQNVSLLTSDPIMSSIFSDTAATTLQEQIGAESSPGRMISDEMIAGSDSGTDVEGMDVFSESAKKWAALAFSEAPKK